LVARHNGSACTTKRVVARAATRSSALLYTLK